MTFEERLRATVSKLMEETETFRENWHQKQVSLVEPMFRSAETVFREKFGTAMHEPRNGGIKLWATYRHKEHMLAVRPNNDRLEIEFITASPLAENTRVEQALEKGETPDFLPLEDITEQALEKIIIRFAARVAREGRKLDRL